MVDWHDPQTLAGEYVALLKVLHTVDGLYIWEFAQTFEWEWAILTRKKRWKWSLALYFACRFVTLAAVVTELVGFNLTEEFNCQKTWLVFLLIFSYVAFALDSLLIVFRVIAIWERQLYIVVSSIAVWLVNVAFLLYGASYALTHPSMSLTVTPTAQADASWNPVVGLCAVVNTDHNRANVLVTLLTDLVLLIIMFAGVLRLRSGSGLWKLLYRHGLIWIALATLAEVPPTTFLFLNLNDEMNLMFQTPALVVITSYLSNLPPASNNVIAIDRKDFGSNTATTSSGGGGGVEVSVGSLDVEFPTSYGRYRAEDLNPTLRAIDEADEDGATASTGGIELAELVGSHRRRRPSRG
ncbi:hypothetical protein FA95DRAFT_1601788 [Auriscalpium vulgare]|uniref:Uncharacterized protein n=1 Tax=Auriscalpium vulgare TaxID=40419 RepID=A0ACB8S8B9_9AGAM|nr:hypothetical protein FA95DRAFT_1601788 [Auriscalpium vulgare]